MAKGISKFIKRDSFDKLMFGYVTALRHNLPSVTLERCITLFCSHFEVEDYPIDTAKKTYARMQAEWLNTLKSNTANGKTGNSTGNTETLSQKSPNNNGETA